MKKQIRIKINDMKKIPLDYPKQLTDNIDEWVL